MTRETKRLAGLAQCLSNFVCQNDLESLSKYRLLDPKSDSVALGLEWVPGVYIFDAVSGAADAAGVRERGQRRACSQASPA